MLKAQMKKLIILITVLLLALIWGFTYCTPEPASAGTYSVNITAAGDNYTAFRSVTEIRQFVRGSKFYRKQYDLGKYDCVSYKDNAYFGFALDFVEYAKENNRLFIPIAEFWKYGET